MKFEKLKVGTVLYDAHSHGVGNTSLKTLALWEAVVTSVNEEDRTVMISWNSNTPYKVTEEGLKNIRYKLKKPFLVRTRYGYRRPSKEELAEHRKNKNGHS